MRPLTPQQEQSVSVRIADQQSQLIVPEHDDSGRDEADTHGSKFVLQGWDIGGLKHELPRDNQDETAATIRMRLGRGWADGARA